MAKWIGSPNYTQGRDGWKIDHITLHIMAGTLAGTDAHFSRSASQVSATYGIGGNGDIHQYVSESNTAWADGDAISNASGISIEHEGGLNTVRCTRACMNASAQLCADIAKRMGWRRLVHDGVNGNVYLHREIPGSTHTTCPDKAPNGLDVDYVINRANIILGNNNNNGGSDMVTQQDIERIAKAVWEYRYDPDKDGRNMYNRIVDLLRNTNGLPARVWEYNWAGDKDKRNMYDTLRAIQKRLDSIEEKMK